MSLAPSLLSIMKPKTCIWGHYKELFSIEYYCEAVTLFNETHLKKII